MNTNLDERALLRFASGEMSEDEETAFIVEREIAGDNAGWREAVLAIVEHRRMVAALAEMASDEPAVQPTAIASQGRQKVKSGPKPWFVGMAALSSLAAGLLVGLVFAHLRDARQDVGPATQPTLARGDAPAITVARPDASPQVAATPVALQDGRALGLEPMIPEDQAASLRKQGFQVEERPTVYIIDGGNGRKWAVPTEKTTVHYVSR